MPSIVTCGIPRSGSTLVWQMVQEVSSPISVHKVHPASWEVDQEALVFISIRDPRDVISSLLRVKLSREGRTGEQPTEEDLKNVLHHSEQSWLGLADLREVSQKVVLRYEHFYDDYNVIWDAIWAMLGIRPAANSRELIESQYNLLANIQRAQELKDFNEVDEANVHGDHIAQPIPGGWRKGIPGHLQDQVANHVREVCWGWGYAK